MTRCKNCGHPIKKKYEGKWLHSMSRSSGWSMAFEQKDCEYPINKHTFCECYEPIPKKVKKRVVGGKEK